MKATLLILLLFCCRLAIAQINISWPVDKTVYQRPNSGSVTFTVSGQCGVNNAGYQLQKRVSVLDVNTGATTSIYQNWTTFATSTPYGGLFNQTFSLSCGWYFIEIRALVTGNPNFTPQGGIKVGVGDVFVVAGQSNAQGVTTTSSYSEAPYDGVVADLQLEDCSKDIPKYPQLQSMYQDYPIGQQGPTNWAYTVMGNRLAAQTGCPVAVFNTARVSTTVNNWDASRNNGTATNVYNGNVICGQSGMPYSGLKNALNYYGSIFGVRAVLWHQGEADNQQSTSTTDYQTKLTNVISQTRTDFNTGLSWYISRATYNPEVAGPPPLPGHSTTGKVWPNVITAQNNVGNVNKLGPATDNIGIPRNDAQNQVHFGGIQLKDLGEAWKNSTLTSATPITANSAAATISVVKNGSSYTLTAQPPTGFTNIRWVTSTDRYSAYFNTSASFTTSTSGSSYRYYATNSQGNIVISPKVDIPLPAGSARMGAFEVADEDHNGYILQVNPNPITNQTAVKIQIPHPGPVQLDIIDEQGLLIKRLTNRNYEPGNYEFSLENVQLSPGLYVCRLKTDDFFLTKKIVKVDK